MRFHIHYTKINVCLWTREHYVWTEMKEKGGVKDFHGNVKQQSESKNSFISMTRSWNLFMYSLSEWTIKVHRLAHERWEPAWGLCQHRWRLLCSYPVVDIHLSVPHWDPLIKHWKNISSFRAKDKTNQRCFGGRAHYLIWISSCSIMLSVLLHFADT